MGTLSVDKLMKTSTGAAEFTLPATDGTAGQVLQTDGSGQLSVAALAADTVGTAQLSATGTASATTYLRGDNAWTAVTSTTINNNANNKLITGSGTANTGESSSTNTTLVPQCMQNSESCDIASPHFLFLRSRWFH